MRMEDMSAKGMKYWVACSGGVDSVVLTHLMKTRNQDFGLLHCNFQLRGDASDGDEMFVRELAEKLHTPVRVKVFDTQKYMSEQHLNLELAARELRYNWFDEIIREENATVLLAQHYNDQMETFFLQLRRGAQIQGLSGMAAYRNGYLRPLLKYRKRELITLAEKQGWTWREDGSNAKNDYKRNWYRNEILPWLAKIDFPLVEIIPLMEAFQAILHQFQIMEIPDTITLQLWDAFPIWYRNYLLSVHQLGEYSEKEITRLVHGEKGKFIGNDKAEVWNEGGGLCFILKEKNTVNYSFHSETINREMIDFSSKDTLFVAAEKIKGNLSIRKWKTGDHFQPLGMNGEKTMGKFLRDRKVPSYLKNEIRVLVDESDTIIGVFGFGVGENYKIGSNTAMCIKVNLIPED